MTEQNRGLLYFTDIEFIEPTPVENNPMITKVKIRIAQGNLVRNGFDISRQVLEDAAHKSLGLTPIVAFFNPFKGDFGEHGQQAVMNERGEYVTTTDTKAVGVIPENPIIFWDEEGYLTTFGYLWTSRYEETIQALEGRPQSMELSEKHTIMRPSRGNLEILETKFEGLCILGENVPPAFEKASIEGVNFTVLNKDELNIDKGEDKFMADLKFALQHDFDDSSFEPPVIVDVDGEEKDKENREKVTSAIDELDELANTTTDPAVVEGIDQALDSLVEAEVDMQKEAKIIPVTEEAIEGLKGQPTSEDGVVSSKVLNYASKKKEEEELATKKKEEDKELIEQEETSTEEAPAVKETEPAAPAKEDETPSDDGTTETADGGEAKPEQGEPEPEAVEDEEGTIDSQADEAGASVSQSNQGEAATAISTQRETAGAKRAGNLLGDVSNAELFEVLTTRIAENNQEVLSNLTQLLNNGIPSGLPESNPDGVHTDAETTREDLGTGEVDDPSQIKVEDPDNEVDDTNANMPSDKGNSEVTPEEAVKDEPADETDGTRVSEEGPEEEVVAEETEVVKEETTEEVPEEQPAQEEQTEEPAAEEDEEDKKKKARFSLDGDFDLKEILQSNIELERQVSELKAQNKSLLEFKLGIELEEKEATLANFSLDEESKETIRLDFAQLTIEEIEERAVIAEWKAARASVGQNHSGGQIQFSLPSEDIMPIEESSGEDTLEAVLERAQAKLRNR